MKDAHRLKTTRRGLEKPMFWVSQSKLRSTNGCSSQKRCICGIKNHKDMGSQSWPKEEFRKQ